jgi:endonuclease-3 related protein
LRKKYGQPNILWPQWCALRKTIKERGKIIIGAILTQHTSWHNADLALQNLKREKLLSFEALAQKQNYKKMAVCLKPAGFHTTKPKRLYGLAQFIIRQGGLKELMGRETARAREELLALYGIGQETADTILLYGLGKLSFVIDEYTKRLVLKHKLSRVYTYDYLKQLFEKGLPKSIKIYQDFHALIIIEQKGRTSSKMERI